MIIAESGEIEVSVPSVCNFNSISDAIDKRAAWEGYKVSQNCKDKKITPHGAATKACFAKHNHFWLYYVFFFYLFPYFYKAMGDFIVNCKLQSRLVQWSSQTIQLCTILIAKDNICWYYT